jgi:hypothetical protein
MEKRLAPVLFALAVPALVLAHNGMREIKGTIAKIAADSIVVKRAADNVDETVGLTNATAYKAGSAAATHADMRVGSRVVVHFGKDGKALEIHLPAKH